VTRYEPCSITGSYRPNVVIQQMTRSIAYAFTLNNYTDEELEAIRRINGYRYLVLGKEVGDSGTPHIQGTIYFRNQRSFNSVKELIPRAHLEHARNISASITYCKKDGNYEEHGDMPSARRSSEEIAAEKLARSKRLIDPSIPLMHLIETGELSPYCVNSIKKARMVLMQDQDQYTHTDVRGLWYVGPPGTGKSRQARELYPEAYIKPQNKWFDGYTGQKAIILDDLDTDTLSHYIKIWADRYACPGEIKGGHVNLVHRVFIVTSNYTIEQLFKEPVLVGAIKRRFHVTHFRPALI